jgi:hypothetical protein
MNEEKGRCAPTLESVVTVSQVFNLSPIRRSIMNLFDSSSACFPPYTMKMSWDSASSCSCCVDVYA